MAPVLVFGRRQQDLLAAASPDEAIDHVHLHVAAKDHPNRTAADFEFFDLDGNPLRLIETGGGIPAKLAPMSPEDYVAERVRWLITSVVDGGGLGEVRQQIRPHLDRYLDGTEDLPTLAVAMATGPKHSRGPAHRLCHLLHLC